MQEPNLSQVSLCFFNVVPYGVQLSLECNLASTIQRGAGSFTCSIFGLARYWASDNRLLARVTSPLQASQLSPECEVAHTPLKKCRAGLAWVRGDSQGIGDGSRRRTRHL